MKETSVHPSLLSYLLPDHKKFCLRLQTSDSQRLPGASLSSPFAMLNDEDPLAHTFRAAFVTDFGCIIKEVNLLIQRDTIQRPAEQKIFLSNSAIDRYWQQAMAVRRARAPERSILLAGQIDRQQQLRAFAPLFYCRQKEVFFELPCPECGLTLQLCKDDTLLQTAGLLPYTTSLRRYLFCPSCFHSNGRSPWYTREKQADEPSTVHDCRQLFLDLGKLDSNPEHNRHFPCRSCQQHTLCYGSQQAIHDTVYALSFYPFYMLITECDSLDGFHFLTLLNQNLFLSPQEPPPSSSFVEINTKKKDEQNHDGAILAIIQKLAEKYQQKEKAPHTHRPPPPASVKTHEELSGTTLSLQEKGTPCPTSTIGSSNTADDLSQETVIIGDPAEYLFDGGNTLQTKNILPSDNSAHNENTYTRPSPEEQADKKTREEDDGLAETIILRPGKKL